MKRVAAGLYQLETGGIANVFLIEGTSDLTLVDAGSRENAEGLLAELGENGFSWDSVGRIVITHAHPDHAGGLKALLERHRVRVYAQEKDVPVLLGKAPPRIPGLKDFFSGLFRGKPGAMAPAETVVSLGQMPHIRGLPQWQVLHTPGHTFGSISLFNPVSQILLCGDVLTNQGGKLRPAEAHDAAALQDSVRVLAGLDCDILCCGHGPVVRGGAFRFIEKLLPQT